MRVAIFGVGRSGTTSLYKLLQDWMSDCLDGGVDFVYEPFLWDRDALNKKYELIGPEWSELSSISFTGVHHHMQMPLFLTEHDSPASDDIRFVEHLLTPGSAQRSLLIKAIRANGRYELFKKVCPELRSLFVIRNPLDVVNSATGIFSFFGDDYHRSDSDRFFRQVAKLYSAELRQLNPLSGVEKEACYWYFMNRYFLDSTRGDPSISAVCHEDYVRNRESVVQAIAGHLGLESIDNLVVKSNKRVGPSVRKVNLTERDFSNLLPYMEMYQALLKEHFPNVDYDHGRTTERYVGKFKAKGDIDPFLGKTSAHIRQVLQSRAKQNNRTVSQEVNKSLTLKAKIKRVLNR